MLVVALTGGIGSGKSTVSDMFKSKHIPVIDTDIIARELAEPGTQAYSQIINTFGESILAKNNTIDRQALRQLIFSSEQKRQLLEKILHPLIWNEVRARLSTLRAPYAVVVVPLLLEKKTNFNEVSFDRILVIDVDERLQIERATERDNSDESIIRKIMKSQVSQQSRLNVADDVINNEGDIDSLRDKINLLHKQYLQLSGKK